MMLNIEGWKVGLRFSAGHMIPKHKKCSRMHGHTYILSAKIHGTPDENHLIMDFGQVKGKLRELAKQLDHKVLVPRSNMNSNVYDLDDLSIISKNIEHEPMSKEPKAGYLEVIVIDKHYILPKSDVVILDIPATTAEELSEFILTSLLESIQIPANVTKVEVGVEEGWGQGAWATKDLQ